MSLKNKRVLITAGPTWVAIDKVRVISNTATGENGILLAKELSRHGAKVTLVLGPSRFTHIDRHIRVVPFTFFDELKDIVVSELKKQSYDCLVQAASVSDYRPSKRYTKKVSSCHKAWQLTLVPTKKIIDLVRKIDNRLFLVGFKYEPEASRSYLLKKAAEVIRHSGSNVVVANTFKKGAYEAYITDGIKVIGPLKARQALAKELTALLETYYGKY